MKKKEKIRERYSIKEGNPTREERIQALYEGKMIKIKTYRTMYYRLDKYKRLCFSYTGHESSFHPYHSGFDYTNVLDDYAAPSEIDKVVCII